MKTYFIVACMVNDYIYIDIASATCIQTKDLAFSNIFWQFP